MAAERVGELLLYGNISNESWWGDEVTPKQIDADLKALGDLDVLNVRINSGGGSVFAGMAIHSIIKRHAAAQKTAYVDGLAASMASIIPMACGKIVMPNNALMMIHKPWAGTMGNAEDMRKIADLLDKIEGQAVDIYQEKSGLEPDEIKKMLASETWMTAKEALELGFIDEIEHDVQIAASMDGDFLIMGENRFNISSFKNFNPEPYREAEKPPEPVANNDPEPEPDKALSEQSQEFYRLRSKIYQTYEEEI